MRINKHLHLVIPIYADDEFGEVVSYVHSTPLLEEVVDRYFMVLGVTYSTIFSQGLGLAGGPPHAMRVLRMVATERGVWHDGPNGPGVESGLMNEIRRTTMVAAINKDGKWDHLPLPVALDKGVVTPEDRTEVENAIVFFIVAYATLPRAQRGGVTRVAAELWGAQVSSSPFTEWSSSLRTSTATASSGARSPAAVKSEPAPANATVAGKPSRVAF